MSATSVAYDQGLKLSRQGRHLEAISQFELALAAQPDDIRTLFALGNTARSLGLSDAAASFFRKVLAQDPARVEALVNLANLLRTQGQFEAARALLEPALAREPENPDLLLTLGSTFREMGDLEKAGDCYRAALSARADFAAALSNLADLLSDAGDYDQARALYDRAIKVDPNNPQARLNRAVLNFLRGDLKQAWRDYAARAEISGKVPSARLALSPWRGGPLKRVRLLVRAEQGVGDQLMFLSVLPDLARRATTDGGSVILECEPRLMPLAARALPGVTIRPQVLNREDGHVTANYDWLKAAGGANAVALMGDIARWLRPDLESFPATNAFLVPDAQEKTRWRAALTEAGPGPYIGLCWRSGKSGGHRAVQYAPLETWGAFLRDLPGTLVCCQYDASPDEIIALEQMCGRKIFTPPALDQKNELDRTAALLSALDLLVTAPTAVAWLGAGTGTRSLKLLYDTSWTAFGQAHEPLAPSCSCIMPKMRGDWADVFAQAGKIIAGL